jgi:hypothetical protein
LARYFTFTLPTIFWAVGVVAVFCGVAVWMGVAGIIIFVALAVGTFAGLYVCSFLDLGFAFTDLRHDIAKSLIVAVVVTGITYALAKLFGGFGLGILPLSWLIAIKICWMQLEKIELFIIFATTFLAVAVAACIALPFIVRAQRANLDAQVRRPMHGTSYGGPAKLRCPCAFRAPRNGETYPSRPVRSDAPGRRMASCFLVGRRLLFVGSCRDMHVTFTDRFSVTGFFALAHPADSGHSTRTVFPLLSSTR